VPTRTSTRRLAGTALLALLVVVAAACAPPPPPGRGPSPSLQISNVVTGLDHPWDLGFTSGSDGAWMVYTERGGRISARPMSGAAPVPLLQLEWPFVGTGEGGLLGLAVDPEFASNRYVYACYTTVADVRLSRYRVNSFTPGGLVVDAQVVTGMPVNPSGRHSGCRPRFRPGTDPPQLFVGTGDSASDGSIPQNLTSLGGKVLCVLRDGAACAANPGIGDPGMDDRIHSWGHRNVQGIAFTAGGGGYSVEHGTGRDDEVNVLFQGDFGWNPDPPGAGTAYDESQPMSRPGGIAAAWSSGAPTIAPSGATMLQGPQWKGWNGALAMAVLKARELRIVFFDDFLGFSSIGTTFEMRGLGRLRSAVQGPDGNLYISTDNGSMNDVIVRVVPT
jgi:aldose sugar dehydrogenase